MLVGALSETALQMPFASTSHRFPYGLIGSVL
jgi:hypothetical protein